MEITAKMVKDLRESTGAGMMDCKKALAEAEGDLDKAVDVLRTKGLAALAKKAGRATNEGTIAASVSDDAHTGALVEVNCETDFVGRNADFKAWVEALADFVRDSNPASVDSLLAMTYGQGTVQEELSGLVARIGENMGIARLTVRSTGDNGFVGTYIHGGGRIGVLVELSCGKPETGANSDARTLAKDIAMQVAAAQPLFTRRDEVDSDVIEHELSIYRAQAAESGKPAEIQEKMAVGRLEKYYKEVCLVEQVFVKDQNVSVQQHVDQVAKSLGDTISVVGYERFVLGETAAE